MQQWACRKQVGRESDFEDLNQNMRSFHGGLICMGTDLVAGAIRMGPLDDMTLLPVI